MYVHAFRRFLATLLIFFTVTACTLDISTPTAETPMETASEEAMPTAGSVPTPTAAAELSADDLGPPAAADGATYIEMPELAVEIAGLNALAWSPDGDQLVAVGQQTRRWSPATGRLFPLRKGGENAFWSAAWSPDGSQIALGVNNGAVFVRTVETDDDLAVLGEAFDLGSELDECEERHAKDENSGLNTILCMGAATEVMQAAGIKALAWSPDGAMLATVTNDTVELWDAQNWPSRPARTLSHDKALVLDTVWSPDGRVLAAGDGKGVIKLWDTDSGAQTERWTADSDGIRTLAWSPDGTMLAVGGWEGNVRLWDARSGERLGSLPSHTGVVHRVAWSPDGTALVSVGEDGIARVSSIAERAERVVLVQETSAISDAVWSPDGSMLAVVNGDNGVRVWALRPGP